VLRGKGGVVDARFTRGIAPGKKFSDLVSFRLSGYQIGLTRHVFSHVSRFGSNRVGSNTPPIRSNRTLIGLNSIRTDIRTPKFDPIRFDRSSTRKSYQEAKSPGFRIAQSQSLRTVFNFKQLLCDSSPCIPSLSSRLPRNVFLERNLLAGPTQNQRPYFAKKIRSLPRLSRDKKPSTKRRNSDHAP
jgi:hypothetical protein